MSAQSFPWVREPLELYDVYLNVSSTPSQFKAMRREMDSLEPLRTDIAGSTTGVMEYRDDGSTAYHVVFWIDGKWVKRATPSELVGLLAHEASHGVGMILGHVSSGPEDFHPIGEPVAYLHGFVTRWLHRHVVGE